MIWMKSSHHGRDKPDADLDDLPIYWESPEAAKLFGFDYKDGEGDDVFDGLTVRVRVSSIIGIFFFYPRVDLLQLIPILC